MHLVPRTSQRAEISLSNRRRSWRLDEPGGIEEWPDPVRPFVSVRTHSLCERSIAQEIAARGSSRASEVPTNSDRKRESILRSHNPLGAPSADECVSEAGHVLANGLVLADRQLPNSAGMENVGNIVAAERVIPREPEASEGWRPIELAF